jgi:hypothetical protein
MERCLCYRARQRYTVRETERDGPSRALWFPSPPSTEATTGQRRYDWPAPLESWFAHPCYAAPAFFALKVGSCGSTRSRCPPATPRYLGLVRDQPKQQISRIAKHHHRSTTGVWLTGYYSPSLPLPPQRRQILPPIGCSEHFRTHQDTSPASMPGH